MHKWLRALCFVAAALGAMPAHAVLVTYAGANGLSATAEFTLVDSNTISVLLTNTSTAPYGGGGANMVLSSLNFDLGGPVITDGSVVLGAGSTVVERYDPPGAAPPVWQTIAAPDLNAEHGFSSTGVGNTGGDSIANALDAVTSHNNGGNNVVTFTGETGLPSGGLNYGLIATGSTPFGNSSFIMNSVLLTLNLSGNLTDLTFLNNGTYVEFGSDFSYVPGDPDFPDDPDEPVVPEPATLSLLGLGLAGLGALKRKRRLA